jgi:aryl-phospho-beta-D-glucosidase BglC (GH1 family)
MCPSFLAPVQGKTMADTPVLIGEFAVKDSGNNSMVNNDTTVYTPADRMWLEMFAQYSRELSAKAGRPLSWFFWAWNANSGEW